MTNPKACTAQLKLRPFKTTANQTLSAACEAATFKARFDGSSPTSESGVASSENLQFPPHSLNPTGFLAVIVVCENFMNLDGLLYDEQAAF